jgi:hypothetical protein
MNRIPTTVCTAQRLRQIAEKGGKGLKKVFVLAIVILLSLTTLSAFSRTNASELPNGSKAPSGFYSSQTDNATFTPAYVPPQIVTGSAMALLIEDEVPWDNVVVVYQGTTYNYWDANQQALNFLGITYDLVWSVNLGSINLSTYKFIILASTQPTSTYANIQANIGKINTYVWNGGIYLAHVCDTGWWNWPGTVGGSDWTGYSILPNGVTHVGYYYSQNIFINNPTSPIVAGLSNAYFYGWSYSTHGWFANVPAGADTVMVTDNNHPTYIIYDYGSGRVLATMQTIEWGYGPFVWYWVGGWRPWFLLNELYFAETFPAGYGFNSTLPPPPPNLPPPGLGAAGVGGFVVSVDKFGLLAPYIGLASTIIAATIATTIYVKRAKHRKED